MAFPPDLYILSLLIVVLSLMLDPAAGLGRSANVYILVGVVNYLSLGNGQHTFTKISQVSFTYFVRYLANRLLYPLVPSRSFYLIYTYTFKLDHLLSLWNELT